MLTAGLQRGPGVDSILSDFSRTLPQVYCIQPPGVIPLSRIYRLHIILYLRIGHASATGVRRAAVLAHVGDAALAELFLGTELFSPIPGGSFLQLSGRPIAKVLQQHKAAVVSPAKRALPRPMKRPADVSETSTRSVAKRAAIRKEDDSPTTQRPNLSSGSRTPERTHCWRSRVIPRRKIFYNYHFSRTVGLPRGSYKCTRPSSITASLCSLIFDVSIRASTGDLSAFSGRIASAVSHNFCCNEKPW
eukprot:SAG31_NODE_201_length_20535_cov_15.315081_16_plen_247_part_00